MTFKNHIKLVYYLFKCVRVCVRACVCVCVRARVRVSQTVHVCLSKWIYDWFLSLVDPIGQEQIKTTESDWLLAGSFTAAQWACFSLRLLDSTGNPRISDILGHSETKSL